MPRRADHWRIGLVAAPITAIAHAGTLEGFSIDWLNEPADFAFDADPFALERDGQIHLFTEAFDYRERHGRIVHRSIGRDGRASEPRLVLEEEWHLSYPMLVEADGELL